MALKSLLILVVLQFVGSEGKQEDGGQCDRKHGVFFKVWVVG
jgi:hypothetical protein